MNIRSLGWERRPRRDLHRSEVPRSSWFRLLSVAALAASFGLTTLPRPGFGQPDPTLSYYVPQTGPVATPTEGTNAIRQFVQCPNNDVTTLRTNNARIKIVVKDALGVAIPGIAAADICVRFNGGTLAQGFPGGDADSIIANSTWNLNPLCPDPRCLEADAPTDAAGVTYITFAGTTPGSPGVATRDPFRKWGHYDSELPVYVLGVPLSGRLTSVSANGSYVLRIKNVDIVDGLAATFDAGEHVSFRDINVMFQEISTSSSLTYWLDFNGDGVISVIDYNVMISHYLHDCTHPNNP